MMIRPSTDQTESIVEHLRKQSSYDNEVNHTLSEDVGAVALEILPEPQRSLQSGSQLTHGV